MAKYLYLLWVLPSPCSDNMSCSLIALQEYKNKTAEHAVGEIFVSLHGDFLAYGKISYQLLISNEDIFKKKS